MATKAKQAAAVDASDEFVPASERAGATVVSRALIPQSDCGKAPCTGPNRFAPNPLAVGVQVTGKVATLTATVAAAGACVPRTLRWVFGDGSSMLGGDVVTHTYVTGTYSARAYPVASSLISASPVATVTVT